MGTHMNYSRKKQIEQASKANDLYSPESNKIVKQTEIKNIEETVIEVTTPDGTTTKTTKKIDKTVTTDTHQKELITETKRPNYRASALIGYNFNSFLPVYGAAIEKRIIGNISVGVWGTTDRSVGASLSLEF